MSGEERTSLTDLASFSREAISVFSVVLPLLSYLDVEHGLRRCIRVPSGQRVNSWWLVLCVNLTGLKDDQKVGKHYFRECP